MNRIMVYQFEPIVLKCLILVIISTFAIGQVNTEVLRKTDLENGWYTLLSGNLGYQSGNSEYLTLKTGVRFDFLKNRNYSFLVVHYTRGTQAQKVFINKGFAHLRGVHTFRKSVMGEIFIQKEFNDFINLKDRDLVGGGLRLNIFNYQNREESSSSINLFLGVGGMWEKEELDETQSMLITKMIRSTNYISGKWVIDERVSINLISYFQISLESASDFRSLAEGRFSFLLSKAITFQTTLNFRYDNEPPGGIKKHDLELTNGLSISI